MRSLSDNFIELACAEHNHWHLGMGDGPHLTGSPYVLESAVRIVREM